MTLMINVINNLVISKNYFTLRHIIYDIIRENSAVLRHNYEVYDCGNSATILLYNRIKLSVVLIRLFRITTWLNSNSNGQLIETCAGRLDGNEPEYCVRKEAIEETGFKVVEVRKVFELYMSPGSITELVHFFIAEYTDILRIFDSRGIEDEYIEVLEIPFRRALEMVKTSEICDGKTVILLQYLQLSGLMD